MKTTVYTGYRSDERYVETGYNVNVYTAPGEVVIAYGTDDGETVELAHVSRDEPRRAFTVDYDVLFRGFVHTAALNVLKDRRVTITDVKVEERTAPSLFAEPGYNRSGGTDYRRAKNRKTWKFPNLQRFESGERYTYRKLIITYTETPCKGKGVLSRMRINERLHRADGDEVFVHTAGDRMTQYVYDVT